MNKKIKPTKCHFCQELGPHTTQKMGVVNFKACKPCLSARDSAVGGQFGPDNRAKSIYYHKRLQKKLLDQLNELQIKV